MPNKGPSNQYDNTRGGAPHKPTSHINYKYAKEFNKSTLKYHFEEHGKEFRVKTQKEYEVKSVRFANKIDHRNCKSVVDGKGITYKFNIKTREFVMVDKRGVILTYHHKDKFSYINKKGERKCLIIR